MTEFGLMNPIPPIGGLNAAVELLFQSTVPCLFEAATMGYLAATKPCTRQSLTCQCT